MELSSIGSTYFDDYRLNVQMNGLSEYGQPKAQDFAELLNKARTPQQDSDTGASRKPAIDKTGTLPRIDRSDKLYEQCLELETFLIKNLIGSMRKTVQKSGLINEGFAGKMYEDMLYDEYAKDFAKNAGFGFADQAYMELTGQRGRVPA